MAGQVARSHDAAQRDSDEPSFLPAEWSGLRFRPPMLAPLPRILVLFAHPAPQHSRLQARLYARARRVKGVTGRDLYELYPDFDVDVPAEQEQLLAHDLVVMQHPLYWYSTPPLLKQWIDLVLEHGWAYGRAGTALRGKTLLSAVSAGGRADAYTSAGYNGRTVREFLAPVEYTARLCGMRYPPPFVVHGAHRMGEPERAAAAEDYANVLTALRDGTLDLDALAARPFLDPAVLAGGAR
jgi:glutathione-regulated potassium-efflux system ancillary protein KefG